MRIAIQDVVNRDATLIRRRAWSDPEIYELEKRGAPFRYMPADAPVDRVAWGSEGLAAWLGGAPRRERSLFFPSAISIASSGEARLLGRLRRSRDLADRQA